MQCNNIHRTRNYQVQLREDSLLNFTQTGQEIWKLWVKINLCS